MTGEAVSIRPEGPVPYGLANEAMHRLAERGSPGEIPDTRHPARAPTGLHRGAPRAARRAPVVAGRAGRARRRGPSHRPRRSVHLPRTRSAGRLPDPRPRRHTGRCGAPAADGGGRDPDRVRVRRRRASARGRADGRVARQREDVCDRRPADARPRHVARFRAELRSRPLLVRRDRRVGLPGHGVTSLSRLAGRLITVPEVAPVLERTSPMSSASTSFRRPRRSRASSDPSTV